MLLLTLAAMALVPLAVLAVLADWLLSARVARWFVRPVCVLAACWFVAFLGVLWHDSLRPLTYQPPSAHARRVRAFTSACIDGNGRMDPVRQQGDTVTLTCRVGGQAIEYRHVHGRTGDL